jgi:molecular chaperone GrpE
VAEVFRRKRADEPVPVDGGWVAYAEVEPHLAELARLQQERTRLIDLCLYARDRVSSAAAAERVDAGLVELGVTPLRPDGQPFDPAQHEAAATVPTEDPALHGTVAETEVPGYADRGALVRPPVVSVYRRDHP